LARTTWDYIALGKRQQNAFMESFRVGCATEGSPVIVHRADLRPSDGRVEATGQPNSALGNCPLAEYASCINTAS
jgi:hypothetical protein